MRRLAIETAAEACSVALFENGTLVAHAHELVGRGHAERLVPMIAGLSDRGRAQQLLVDCGPGSFTGVRVGLAAARGLGLAWRAEVRGFSSMAVLAAQGFAAEPAAQVLTVAIIGGHGEYFLQRFERLAVRPITPLASLTPDKAAARCGDDLVVGSGAEAMQAHGARGPALAIAPDARCTALLPLDLVALPPRPIYGRAPDARLPA